MAGLSDYGYDSQVEKQKTLSRLICRVLMIKVGHFIEDWRSTPCVYSQSATALQSPERLATPYS